MEIDLTYEGIATDSIFMSINTSTEGKTGEYMPLIEFCSKVHLGKQTSFGLGKIKTERI